MAAGEVLWTPPSDVLERSRIGRYLHWLADRQGRDLIGGARDPAATYQALWRWSVEDLAGFWGSIWEYFDVVAEPPAQRVLDEPHLPGARWFPGARLNYAENVLRMPGRRDDEQILLGYSQTRDPVTLTAAGLREEVRRVRAGLRRLGVRAGDRVAAYAPNIPETAVVLLATASLGAVFSSCAPEFGVRSVVDRWRQIGPKVLVAVDGYRYGDKPVERTAEVAAIQAELASVEHTVILSYLDSGSASDALPGSTSWPDLCAPTDEPLEFARVLFDHPLYVLYSSGTTGLPKPIVHGHGGILVEHLKMLALHHDLGPADRFFWFTTTGWMMWNYLLSGPAVGASVVLYDGNPAHPDLGTLWRLAGEAGITYFGTSAPYLLSCRKAGIVPRRVADLSAIRGVGSTGAPLPPEGFRWVYENVAAAGPAAGPADSGAGPAGAGAGADSGVRPADSGAGLLLASVSGGTDMCTAFVGGAPLLPVRAGRIACRCLGARVEAYAEDGGPVVGRLGELVITAPMPSMPVGFWNDPTGERYREAYFSTYPGVWRHGDWITIDTDGTCMITGRSDATLNRGGVRLGTSEFYSAVEGHDSVIDSLVVHLEDPEGGPGELLLFVVLADGVTLDAALRAKINQELRTGLSPRHVPDEIYQVAAVPRTLSGKKLEVPVKRILTGTPVDSAAAKGALANPESLVAFEQLAKERA